ESMSRGEVNYPFWFSIGGGIDLNLFISDVVMSDNEEYLKAAGAVKMAFPLRQDTKEVEKMSLAWELEFADLMKNANFSTVDYAYAISQSLSLELDRGTKGDIFYFSLTFTMMITYASVVSA
ncbi:hypothetical protein BgiMline_012937, partial [Biomphalaria glabrata]